MPAVGSSVREFTIAFYPPAVAATVFFVIALLLTLAAGAWLGAYSRTMRAYFLPGSTIPIIRSY